MNTKFLLIGFRRQNVLSEKLFNNSKIHGKFNYFYSNPSPIIKNKKSAEPLIF